MQLSDLQPLNKYIGASNPSQPLHSRIKTKDTMTLFDHQAAEGSPYHKHKAITDDTPHCCPKQLLMPKHHM